MGESREDRTRFVETLDSVERTLIRTLRVLLWVALLGVLALVAAAIMTRKPGGNTQGEYYYFGVATLLVLWLIVSRFSRLRAREQRAESRQLPGRSILSGWSVESSSGTVPLSEERGDAHVRSWQFRFGDPPAADASSDVGAPPGLSPSFSRSVNIPLASLPANVMPDEATLDAIAGALQLGESLDDVCARVQPAYRGWSAMQRRAYRFLVETRLQARQ